MDETCTSWAEHNKFSLPASSAIFANYGFRLSACAKWGVKVKCHLKLTAFWEKNTQNSRAMTTNPFAYYDDEPLPQGARPLSVTSDGEEEPDMEPRCPFVLEGQFVAFFRLAIRTYRIEVTQKLLECRLPNREFVQWSREEARKRVEISGSKIYLHLPDGSVYCFKKNEQDHDKSSDLALARLKTWLKPAIDAPEEAYQAVWQELHKKAFGVFFHFMAVFYCIVLAGILIGPFNLGQLSQHELWPTVLYQWGMVLLRVSCLIVFAVLFIMGCVPQKNNLRLLRVAVILGLMVPVCSMFGCFAFGVFPYYPGMVFLEAWPPFFCYGQYRRWRRAESQLQRENGLI